MLIASSPVKACLQQQGHGATCQSGATGLEVKKPTTAAGSWTVTLAGATDGASATVDFELTYPAAAPSLEISGIPFAGSMAKTGLDLTMVATALGGPDAQRQLGRHPAGPERRPLDRPARTT